MRKTNWVLLAVVVAGAVVTFAGGAALTGWVLRERPAPSTPGLLTPGNPPGTSARAATGPALPSEEEVGDLVRGTLEEFAAACKAGELTSFYEGMSRRWKDARTLEQTRELAAPYLRNPPDLSWLSEAAPQFASAPSLTSTGALRAKGEFTMGGALAGFTTLYVWEDGSWKLADFEFRLEGNPGQ